MKDLYNEIEKYWDCELVNDEIILDDLVITQHEEYSLINDDTTFYRIDRNNKTISSCIKSVSQLIQELELLIEE